MALDLASVLLQEILISLSNKLNMNMFSLPQLLFFFLFTVFHPHATESKMPPLFLFGIVYKSLVVKH